MIREFLFPYYQQLLANARRRQIDQTRRLHLQIDTDGFCDPVIPLYRELGLNCMSPFEVAAGCDALRTGREYPDLRISGGIDKRVLSQGPDAIDRMLDALRPGATVIDTTTGSPEESAALCAMLAGRGVDYLEALIGGSSSQVRAGDAMLMCGGAQTVYERCRPLFHTCFRDLFYLGDCGQAARMKLVLNLILGLNRAVLAEGLCFAEACGLDAARALEILKVSPAYSRVMDTKGSRMVESRFEPEARLAQHLKDVRVILDLGARTGAKLPLSALHRELLEEAERAGYGGADNSAVICAYRNGGTR